MPDRIFTDRQVWEEVKVVAPRHNLNPILIMAICEQECSHLTGKRGSRIFDVAKYNCSTPRMEPSYFERYIRDMDYSTASETLLASSYGIMQMMGESLRECKNKAGENYFEWWLCLHTKEDQERVYLNDPMSPFCVINALDHYCCLLQVAIDWGCYWFEKKLESAKGNEALALLFWNGGAAKNYPSDVANRIVPLTKRLLKIDGEKNG